MDSSELNDPSERYAVSQFDNVRIVSTDETDSRGYAGRSGVCYGFTTPSVTNVDVVGGNEDDFAFNVHFEEEDVEDAWFAPDLVELVDHGAGTTISIGDKSFVRRADGEWDETHDRKARRPARSLSPNAVHLSAYPSAASRRSRSTATARGERRGRARRRSSVAERIRRPVVSGPNVRRRTGPVGVGSLIGRRPPRRG